MTNLAESLKAFFIWSTLTLITVILINRIATRDIRVYANDHIESYATADQVIVKSVRTLESKSKNWWWVYDRNRILVIPDSSEFRVPGYVREVSVITVEVDSGINTPNNLAIASIFGM